MKDGLIALDNWGSFSLSHHVCLLTHTQMTVLILMSTLSSSGQYVLAVHRRMNTHHSSQLSDTSHRCLSKHTCTTRACWRLAAQLVLESFKIWRSHTELYWKCLKHCPWSWSCLGSRFVLLLLHLSSACQLCGPRTSCYWEQRLLCHT